MPIKASSAAQIESLIADLNSEQPTLREAAIARLTVAGSRAVDRLLLLVNSDASSSARAAALRALEAIADPRTLDRILDTVDAPDGSVASAAISAASAFLRGQRGATVVDRLTQAAMDPARGDVVRIAALRGLSGLERSTIAPLLEALRHDPSEAVRSATAQGARIDPADILARAAAHELPDEPGELVEAVTRAGDRAPLPHLLHIIERVHEREQLEPEARRLGWTRARGRLHAALASRGSRIALFDLRESIAAALSPLPVDFLAALSAAGDASCLEAIAAAHERSTSLRSATDSGESWWRDRLADAFRTIVKREHLTRRHAVMKKIERRWGSALDDLCP